MDEKLPFFLFQHYHGKWITYTEEDIKTLNRAVQRNLKTVTLPNSDSKKKISVNFETMIQKNNISGFQQNIRCLIHHSKNYYVWLWKDDHESYISFTPRAALLLEIAYVKKEKEIEIFLKDAYKISLEDYKQTNLQTNYVRDITRSIVDVSYPKGDKAPYFLQLLQEFADSDDFISKMSREDINRCKAFIFNIDFSPIHSQSSSPIVAPPNEVISTLSAEAQASSSAPKETVAVDPDFLDAAQYSVYVEDDIAYSATLNYSNVIDNNNKYFIIQLLKKNDNKAFIVWFHWGRLGYKGSNSFTTYRGNLKELLLAKSDFEKKFFSKTGNEWSKKKNFEKVPGKYDLVYSDLMTENPITHTTVGSRLDIKVQGLLELISNKKNLEEAAKELCFDAKKTPLGKIKAQQILEGYSALRKISSILKEKKGQINNELTEACSTFYTKIPHDFKRKKPPILTTLSQVKEKIQMLEDLTKISLAYGVIDSTADKSVNIIDKYYEHLNINISVLDHSSDEFQALKKVLTETHGITHSAYSMELIDAFKCEKNPEDEIARDIGNKKLLWHGSRLSNWLGILKMGLQIAPPEAPSTGYMFGKGVYFADCSSKSANYCFATKKNDEGLLLLSEVVLGRSKTIYEAEDCSSWMGEGFHSIFAPGRTKPTGFEATVLSPDAVVPVGPLVESDEDVYLQYNEYVVYDNNQVFLKYLLRIKFHFM